MCPDFFPGCSHLCSHNVLILMCICTKQPSRTWSTGVGMFYRPMLKVATHQRYIVPNMCSNLSICPSSFLQAYNAILFKWPNCDNRCKMLGTIYRRMTLGAFMTVRMREYVPALLPEGYIVYWWDCLGMPYCDVCVSFGLNLSSIIYS